MKALAPLVYCWVGAFFILSLFSPAFILLPIIEMVGISILFIGNEKWLETEEDSTKTE